MASLTHRRGLKTDLQEKEKQNLHQHDHQHSHSEHNEHEHSHEGGLFHSHSHLGPNELLGKGFTTNSAVRITWIGLLVNVAMAGTKAVGGVVFHSQSLIADAVHSLSDMFADFLTLATVNVASKEGSFNRFPLGYGKIESVGTFLVSAVLLFAGISIGWSSLLQIFLFTLPPQIYEWVSMVQIHSHSHSVTETAAVADPLSAVDHHSHPHGLPATTTTQMPNLNAAWIALASIGVKEVLFRKTMKVADETNSKVLVANAWHHRVDSLTAAVAFVTVLGGNLFNLAWLDGVGGGLVSILIIHAGWGSFRDAWYELIDRSDPVDSEHYNNMKRIVEEELQTVALSLGKELEFDEISVLSAGARTNLFLRFTTDRNFTLEEMNEFEKDLLDGIKQKDRYIGKVVVDYKIRD